MANVRSRQDEDNEDVRRRQSAEKDGDEYFVHTRSADRSVWLKLSYLIEKYRVLWYIVIGFLVSMGFNFKTPAENYKELSVRIDTVNVRVDSMFAENRRAAMSREKFDAKIDLLLKFQCLSQSQRDLTIAGVDCGKLGINPKLLPQ